MVEHSCDAVDLNLGCPQNIAKRGRYGAFLSDSPEIVRELVSVLHNNLSIPVFCKVRILPTYEETLAYCRMIEAAGCQLLTVHCRTRDQKGHSTGLADWNVVRRLKQDLTIPVISNGNIRDLQDVEKCISETGVDGVMSAEGILKNPALFSGIEPDSLFLVREYLDICDQYTTGYTFHYVRNHLYKMLKHVYKKYEDIRDGATEAHTTIQLRRLVDEIEHRIAIDMPPVITSETKQRFVVETYEDNMGSMVSLFQEEEQEEKQVEKEMEKDVDCTIENGIPPASTVQEFPA